MKAIFTPTELNKTNHTPQATLSPGHTPTMHPARLRCALRRWAVAAALVLGISLPSTAQTANNAYIFYSTSGYLVNNGGSPGVSTTFNKNAIWVASGALNTTDNRTIYSYSTNSLYLRGGTNTTVTLGVGTGNAATRWRLKNSVLNYNNDNNGHVKYTNNSVTCGNNNGTRFTPSAITINSSTPSNPTISITASNGLTNGGIQLTGNITGTYTPAYYYATVRNYNNNNTQTYYWTENTNATTTQPTSITDWSDAKKTWAVTTGGTYASVDGNGLVTITDNPTGNIVITLTVTKGGYEGTQTFTLTRTPVVETSDPTYSPITVTPSSVTLENEGDQETLVVSNSVTETITTTPAHIKFTASGNDYYYYNNSLNATTPTPSTSNTTLDFYSVSWVASGGDSYLYTLSPAYYSRTSNELTLTRTADKSDSDKSYTLTASAGYGDYGLVTLTTTATIYIPKTLVDIGDLLCNDITLVFGETGKLEPYSTYVIGGTGAPYLNLTYTVSDPTIATVNENGDVTAHKVGSTTVTIQSKKLDGTNGPSRTVTITVTPAPLPAPTITINNSGVATLTDNSGISGATIRYTTDGTTPTASTATIVASGGTVQLTRGQTIMAIVTVDGGNYSPSPVTTEVYVETGTFGGVVYLDDREDHNWSYYQPASALPDGYPARMRSPYPRNVKITYYGYGDNTLSTSEVPSPASNTFNINTSSNDVKVGIGENENIFIYYKTLERDANNRFPYEMIPNPFYVRPKSGNIYTGFYKWRIKSIKYGAVYTASTGGTALSVGSMLDAETTYYFQPTDNTWTNANNATSMEIELEALWAPAEVSTGNTPSFSKGYNSVERNFYVGSGALFSSTTRCTYSSFYPNGTTNGTEAATLNDRSSKATGTAKADSKVEYMTLTGNTTNADAYNVTFGRGIGGSGGTFYPVNASKNVDINFRLRLESGTFGTLYLMADGTNNKYQRFQNNFTFGSDYDRAKGDNSKLTVAQGNAIKNGNSEFSQANQDKPTLTCIIKSGEFQKDYWNNNNNAQYNYGFYCCQDHDNTSYPGLVSLTVEGGHFASIIGGRGNYTVGCITQDSLAFTLRFKGGLVDNSVYGASSNNATYGSRRLIFTGGEVRGWIAAGCNGTSDTDERGQTHGDSYVYVGGNTKVGNSEVPRTNNSAVGGNVFGAGRGGNRQYASIKNSHVAVADNAEVLHNVFGGGFHGHIVTASNLFILGGTTHGNVFGGGDNNSGDNRSIPTVNIHMTGGLVEGGVYGGSNENGIVTSLVNMHIDGGQVGTTSQTANIHGGGLGSNTRVNGNVELTLGTTTQTTPGVTVYGDVYGGSALGHVNGGTNGTTASDNYYTYVTLNAGTINGSLYGGGLGAAGTAANVYGPVTVTVNGGTVNTTSANGSGAVYGCNNINGAPQRAVAVIINGTDPAPDADHYALDAVYGGGNQANYAAGTPTVTVNNCDNSIAYVYGGGNAAHITNGNTDVTIYGGNKIGNVFGGGNGTNTPANVSGNTNVKIYGGTIGRVFGGSNSQGNIGGTINVTAQSQPETPGDTPCPMLVDELYGGGNMAGSKAGKITIGCMNDGDMINYVYGGANQADIEGDIALTMTGGRIGNLFGGNNQSGNISGGIKVDVNWNSDCVDSYLGNVFGGGNLAPYTIPNNKALAVNILNGTVSGNVYGGGKGLDSDHAKGQVTGNPVVTIGDATKLTDNNVQAIVKGDVYGGGDAGDVVGTPVVTVLDKSNTTIGNVYGGGNAADVSGTDVRIQGGHITDDVFGGGHGDKASLATQEDPDHSDKAANVTGSSKVSVTGGIIDRVFAGSNLNGTIGSAPNSTMTLSINKTSTNTPMKIGEVYGGANMADGRAASIQIGCTGTLAALGSGERYGYEQEGIGTVYGGANQANIGTSQTPSDITVSITSGIVGNVYGGNNNSGDIFGTIIVNINKDNNADCASNWYVGNVFGGGNQAVYTAPTGSTNYPAVNIQNGVVSGDVFGGGYGNADDNTKGVVNGNPQVTVNGANASVTGGVYGGGSLAPTVGNPVVTLTNGSTTNIYGGGKAAGITGAPTVNINGGSVTEGIYGGCNASGDVSGAITVNINGGTLGVSGTPLTSGIFGGGFGASTTTSGNVTVNVGDAAAASAAACPNIYGDIYGGSALGTVNDAVADLTTVNINNGTIHGNIYGGGLGAATLNDKGYIASVTTEAVVNGTVHVNIGTETQESNFVTIDGQVFGCNNLAGTPKGNVYVDVYKTAHTAANAYPSTVPTKATDVTSLASTAFAIGAVYGGGNLAHYTTTTENAATHVHIHNCDNTIEYVYGGGNAASSPATDVVIDGGRFNYIFGGGNGKGDGNPGADIVGNAVATINGGLVYRAFGGSNTKGNIGGTSRVDLPNTTTCTRLVNELFGGGNEAPGGSVEMLIPCGTTGTGIVYAGANNADMGTQEDFESGNPVLIKLTVEGGDFTQVFGGNNQGGTIWGNVELYLKGGTIGQAFGGNNLGGNIKGYIKVYVIEDETLDCELELTDVYGGGYNAAYTPADATQSSPQVYIYHKKAGTAITGNVFGGGLGAGAIVTANPLVVIGDDNPNHCVTINGDVYGGGDAGNVVGTPQVNVINKCNTSIGNVYGGGNAADVSATTVYINGGTIVHDVYAGGHGDKASLNQGDDTSHSDKTANVSGNAQVVVTGGTINRVFGGSNTNGSIQGTNSITVEKGANSCDLHINELYGGGNLAAGKAGSISIGCTGSASEGIGDVYGGANQADITNNIALTITGGSIQRVFGGNNTSGDISGTIQVDVNWDSSLNCGYNYLGSVFGGGNLAVYEGSPVVNILNGTVSGNVYGGGNGDPADATQTKGSTGAATVTIGDLSSEHETYQAIVIGDVYGGGNAAKVSGTAAPVVLVQKCNTQVGYVYGGGNAADVPATNVTINGGTIAHDVYAGGHGDKASLNQGDDTSHSDKTANVSGNAQVVVTGGTINRVFGGSNTNGSIQGTNSITVEKGANSCDLHINELYGGGNLAAGKAGSISIGCTGSASEGIGDVYGGANQADITNNIALTITGGSIQRVFGGNNTSGDISGTIQVDVNWDSSLNCGYNYLGSVFGGGNLATYTGSPVVNILNGTVSDNVYGGGAGTLVDGNDRGQAGKVTGNPAVTIGDNVNGHTAIVTGDVYGGGDAADVAGTPVIVVNDCNTQIGYLYGGGNAADVNGTNITVNGGTINMAFGGGHGDKTASSPAKYADVKGNVVFNVYGGTISKVFAGSNSKGDITGTSALTINKTGTCDMIIGEVYGGGNEADGNAGTVTIGCTGDLVDGASGHVANPANIGTTLEGIGAVYGGARAANIGKSDSHSDITLNINSGMVGTVYGGNNEDGDIYGNIQVNINKTSDDCGWYVGNVYGGGNLADYTNSGNDYPEVNIQNGTVSGNVFGGGYGQSARVTANPQVKLLGGTVTGNVYGGGEAAPVTGNPTVTASGTSVTATRLYGGGLGNTAVVTGSTTVTVSAGTYDYVFGGGEAADMSGSVTVNIQGGTVNYDVYGGGALANTNIGNATNYGQNNESITSTSTNTTTVNVTGGLIGGDVYGGGLGQRRGYNGTLTTDNIEDVPAYVYGDVTVNLNNGVDENAKGAVINRIFGSNNVYGTPLGSVTVHVYATQNSSTNDIGSKNDAFDVAAVYGGGNLAAYVPNTAATPTNVIIDGCGLSSIEYVYGGGNAAPTPATHVEIMGSYLIADVFGGGNGKDNINYNGQSVANPGADVGIHKVSQAEYNASSYKYADADYGISASDYYVMYGDTTETIIGSTDVIIYGGHIGQVFGGSNTKGDIIKEAKVTLGDENIQSCPLEVDGVYGGSNEAYMSGAAGIEMKCVNGMKEIYGGSKMADVHDDIVLTITGGHYQKVFGGNNISGKIYGSITVNIEQTGCLPIVIDELYGGGNLAPYSVYGYDGDDLITSGNQLFDDPVINIVSCDTIYKVFGGGLGAKAKVIGNPTININMVKGWTDGRYSGTEETDRFKQYAGTPKSMNKLGQIGTVFGGGNQAEVIGETFINIGTESTVQVHSIKKRIFDAINRSDITDPGYTASDTIKDVTIQVEGVNIMNNVYGGGNKADVTGGTHIYVGPDGEEQQTQGNGAPIRSEQPAQQQPANQVQPQNVQPQGPTRNVSTESTTTRTVTPTRL